MTHLYAIRLPRYNLITGVCPKQTETFIVKLYNTCLVQTFKRMSVLSLLWLGFWINVKRFSNSF